VDWSTYDEEAYTEDFYDDFDYEDYYADVDWSSYDEYSEEDWGEYYDDYSEDYTYEYYDYDYDYYYDDSYPWNDDYLVQYLVSSEIDGYAAIYTADMVSWYLWDESGSICNLDLDWIDPNDPEQGIEGMYVTNDDGTCYYDDFYSTATNGDDGSPETVTGPWGNEWTL